MNGKTIGDVLELAARRLTDAGVTRPRLDARLLLCEALGIGQEVVLGYPERRVPAESLALIDHLVEKRAERRPLSHIVGRKEFWSLQFQVSADTLTPRPETEILVEVALDHLGERGRAVSILDLGTGTGCLLLSLLHELPNGRGVGVDASPEAIAVAVRNAKALGLWERTTLIQGSWCDDLRETFDLVVCNPPYIPNRDVETLEPEVARFEPRQALCGGDDGLDCYRAILWQLPDVLAPGGLAVFEVGAGQAGAVARMAAERGLGVLEVRRDLAGIERCVAARNPLAG